MFTVENRMRNGQGDTVWATVVRNSPIFGQAA